MYQDIEIIINIKLWVNGKYRQNTIQNCNICFLMSLQIERHSECIANNKNHTTKYYK